MTIFFQLSLLNIKILNLFAEKLKKNSPVFYVQKNFIQNLENYKLDLLDYLKIVVYITYDIFVVVSMLQVLYTIFSLVIHCKLITLTRNYLAHFEIRKPIFKLSLKLFIIIFNNIYASYIVLVSAQKTQYLSA